MGFPTGKKSIEALASNSSLVSEKSKWTTELIVNFVPLPPEKEEAYWATIQYFAEIMFADLLEEQSLINQKENTMEKNKYAIDGNTEPSIEGWTDGKTWNGWECITVERKEIVKWLDASGYKYEFDESGEYPILIVHFEDQDEVIESTPLPTEDGNILECYYMDGYCFSKVD